MLWAIQIVPDIFCQNIFCGIPRFYVFRAIGSDKKQLQKQFIQVYE